MPNSDHLEELKKRLYRRGEFKVNQERAGFAPVKDLPERVWPESSEPARPEFFSLNLAKRIFFVSLAFLVVAIGVSFLIISRGGNVVSSENIDISIRAPVSVKGGEVLPLEVIIVNRNPVAIEFSDLAITFPAGTRSADNLTEPQERYREHLGTIEAGAVRGELIRAVLFGKENTEQNIKISLEYRTAGSNAIYEKTKDYKLLLTSSPLSLSISLPEEASSGQEIVVDFELASQAEGILSNILVEASYPSGFSFSTASPPPAFGNNIWRVGDLAPGASRRFRIRGVLEGQNDESKIFRFSAGAASAENPRVLAVPYSSSFETAVLRRSFIELVLTLDGSSDDELAVSAGKTLRAGLSWTNNLAEQIIDAELEVKLAGPALSEQTVFVTDGFYRSSDKTIIWTKQQLPALVTLEPVASGQVNFSFGSFSSASLRGARIVNPAIELEAVFRGTRLKREGGTEIIESRLAKTIKINSEFQLSGRAVRTIGPFVNSGPMPPRVNQETSYTVIWSLTNSSNQVSSAAARAALPPYVKWLGNVSPSTEKVSFDSSRGEIVWQIGLVSPGLGVREVAFQISLAASLSQVNQSPILVSESALSGLDDFTGASLTFVSRELTSRIATDPLYVDEWSRVIP